MLRSASDPGLLADVRRFGRFDTNACLQCGSCTLQCDLTTATASFPRKTLRFALLGLRAPLPPEVARRVVRVRHMCAKMLEMVAGKAIHPAAAVPGGFSRPLQPSEREALLPMAGEALELAKFSIAFAKENIFPKYLDAVKTVGVITSGFLGTVSDDGALDLYDGKLRIDSAGTVDPTIYFTDSSDDATFGFLYDVSENDFHIVYNDGSRTPSFLDDIMTCNGTGDI